MKEDNTIKLKVTVSCDSWVAYGSGSESSDSTLQTAQEGPFPQPYFPNLVIQSVGDEMIVITDGTWSRRELAPAGRVSFSYEREGRENSDGCVCNGRTYYCVIEWPVCNHGTLAPDQLQ